MVRMRADSGRQMQEMAAKYGLKPAQFIRRVLYDLVNPGGPDLSKDWIVRMERIEPFRDRKNHDTPVSGDLRPIPDSQV
jgi:hypothetical protein